jgi:DNA-binding SARP family transcriptional activator
VFAGSFSLDAAEAICHGAPIHASDILDLVSALVDKSLVVMENAAGEARYRLLETLRQYGSEKLSANPAELAAMRAQHAAFFTALALDAERPTFGGASDKSWTERLIVEEGNLRAAADWSEENDDRAETALELGSALHWHWFARGHFREGRRRVVAALKLRGASSPLSRAKALAASSTMAFWLGDDSAILGPATEAVDLLRTLDDPWSLCYALTAKGIGLSMTDPVAAEKPLAEAVALARAERSVLRVFALYWQARISFGRGENDRAHELFHETLALAREFGSTVGIAHSLTMLGMVEVQCCPDEAGPHLLEGLRLHQFLGDILGAIWTLEGIAQHAMKAGQMERSARLLAAVRSERERIGTPWSDREGPPFDAMISKLKEHLGSYLFSMAWSAGSGWSLEQAIQQAIETEEGCAPAAPKSLPLASLAADTAERKTKHVTHTGEIRIPGSLQAFGLGPLRIVLNGKPLGRDAWNSAKPRELLLFLLAHPEGCTREQVGLAFWPEASTEQVRNNFHVTLHRLRKTLGDPHWVPLSNDRYGLDPDAAVQLDAHTFEQQLPAALQRLKAGDAAPLQAVLSQYQGDFLQHESMGDWHLELRDRLRRLYTDALSALGDWWMDRKDWRSAADVYRSMISRDEINEPAYRALMTCLAESGERSEALRLYERLTDVLERELEAQPEEETSELLEKIKAS